MNLTYDLRNEVRQMPSDLTSRQMRLILDKYPPPCVKLRKHSVKSILDAIFYLIKSGYRWRMLPPHYPNWKSVYHHYPDHHTRLR